MPKFVVVLPPPLVSAGVVERDLMVDVAGVGPITVNPPIAAAESVEFSGNYGDDVYAVLVDVDAAGNRSQPSELRAVLTDTIAPPQPGMMGIRVTSEE